MGEHVILIGVAVEGDSREDAELFLHEIFPHGVVQADHERWQNSTRREVSWWTAEDERYDGSDNNSATFVPVNLEQEEASEILARASATREKEDGYLHNVTYGPSAPNIDVTLTEAERKALEGHLDNYVNAYEDNPEDLDIALVSVARKLVR